MDYSPIPNVGSARQKRQNCHSAERQVLQLNDFFCDLLHTFYARLARVLVGPSAFFVSQEYMMLDCYHQRTFSRLLHFARVLFLSSPP